MLIKSKKNGTKFLIVI